MLKKIYLTLVVLFLSQGLLFAQNNKNNGSLKMARKEYKALRYVPAIEVLLNYLKYNPENIEAKEMLANSYRKIKDYNNTVISFAELTKLKQMKPEWALYYAEALANKQQYKESEEWYNKYLQLASADKTALSFAKAYANVKDFLKSRGDWKVSYLNLNTAASEYSPMYYKNGIAFVSNRRMQKVVKNVFEWDGTPYSDLYFVDKAKIKALDPDSVMDALRKEIKASGRKLYKENDDDTDPTSNDSHIIGSYNLKLLRDTLGDYLAPQVNALPFQGAINSKYHEGSAILVPGGGSIMFTRNNYYNKKYTESKDGINKLKIFTAYAPSFTTIEPFQYNNDQYSVGHPALNNEATLLIFSSDMPGGFGGTDLYYCTRPRVSSNWSKPINMGPIINTAGNEMFPVLGQDNVLLFSSTGHVGLGGLDIFEAALDGAKPLHNPVNVGAPINSSVDDFGMIREIDGQSGYFTSNRKGSDDIYEFRYIAYKIKIKGIVVDAKTGRLINNSSIDLNNSNLLADSGKFEGTLEKETDYQLKANAPGYTNCTPSFISTKGINRDTTLTVTIQMCTSEVPKPINVKPVNCDSLKDVVAVRKIYYDLDKSLIRPDAHEELRRLIKVLNDHPKFNVLLASHTDSRASSKYNDALSMRRSVSARAYLLANGIPAGRIKIEAFGKSRLTNGCVPGVPCPESEQQLNRRTEFVLIYDGRELQNADCEWINATISYQPASVIKPKLINCDSVKTLVAVRKIYYDLDKSFIRDDAYQELTNLMSVLNAHKDFNVILASHTDSRASGKYNDALSMRRSLSAKAYLVAHGIPASRLKVEAFGKSRLTNPCKVGIPCSEADQQLNRRTEFILIKKGKELQNVSCDALQSILTSQ